MTPKHTQGNLSVFVGNADGRGLIRLEIEETGRLIATMPRGAKSEADAIHIEKCWRDHYPLNKALRDAIEIIEDLYSWEVIGASFKEGGHENWRGCRKDMPEGLFEIDNQAGVHPDDLLPKLAQFKSLL